MSPRASHGLPPEEMGSPQMVDKSKNGRPEDDIVSDKYCGVCRIVTNHNKFACPHRTPEEVAFMEKHFHVSSRVFFKIIQKNFFSLTLTSKVCHSQNETHKKKVGVVPRRGTKTTAVTTVHTTSAGHIIDKTTQT